MWVEKPEKVKRSPKVTMINICSDSRVAILELKASVAKPKLVNIIRCAWSRYPQFRDLRECGVQSNPNRYLSAKHEIGVI